MTFKEFSDNSKIELTLFININGEESLKATDYSLDSLAEQFYKLDRAITNELWQQYEDKFIEKLNNKGQLAVRGEIEN